MSFLRLFNTVLSFPKQDTRLQLSCVNHDSMAFSLFSQEMKVSDRNLSLLLRQVELAHQAMIEKADTDDHDVSQVKVWRRLVTISEMELKMHFLSVVLMIAVHSLFILFFDSCHL